MDQVVILARGLGTRMRKSDPAVALDPALAAAADSGVKAMIPIGRPFLDYVLGVAADAGITRACLVVGPEHGADREVLYRVASAADDDRVRRAGPAAGHRRRGRRRRTGRRPAALHHDQFRQLLSAAGLLRAARRRRPGRGGLRPGDLGGREQYPGRADLEVLRGRGRLPTPTARGVCSGSSRSPTKPRWPGCRGRWA